MSAVWPETTVEENNLDRNISRSAIVAEVKQVKQLAPAPLLSPTAGQAGTRRISQVAVKTGVNRSLIGLEFLLGETPESTCGPARIWNRLNSG
jgi:hypothetical protein